MSVVNDRGRDNGRPVFRFGMTWAGEQFRSLDKDNRHVLGLAVVLVLSLVIFSLLRPEVFPSVRSLQAVAQQFPELGILAMGMMLTMLTGGIDLSVVSTANLAGILAALTMTALTPVVNSSAVVVPAGIAVAIVVGTVAGVCNGWLVTRIGITPILATLGTMTLYAGMATVISGGSSVFGVPAFVALGDAAVLGLPIPLLLFILAALTLSVVLTRTPFGINLYLYGSNPVAARFAGLPVRRLLMKTYALSGLLAAIAGLIFLAHNNAAKPDYGETYVLLVVLIVILAGVNYLGGSGKMSGLVLSVLLLQVLSTGLNLVLYRFSGSNFFKEFAWGAVLILVMVVGRRKERN